MMDENYQMDSKKEGSSREGVQRLFNKILELENKRRQAAQARIPSDPNTWQQIRENYEAIILEDHAFSEQHEIEYALWQLHYRRIEELRSLFNAAISSAGATASQNGKGPGRPRPDRIAMIRAQLKTFLSEATGFYHDLMLKIRAKCGLPLGHFSDDPDNRIPMSKDGNKSTEAKKGLISCHRCLIYLGDLARYKGIYGDGDSKTREFSAASSYYMQASSLWPSSGNPHHQLAILAGYSNDELTSIYRYFRSLAVDIPFTTARDNLILAFEKNRQNYSQLVGDAKITLKASASRKSGRGRMKGETTASCEDTDRVVTSSVKERTSGDNFELLKSFVTRFIRLNGILYTRTSLETFADVFSLVKNELSQLLSSGPGEEFRFGSDGVECGLTVVRMVAIIIYTVQNLNKENETQSYADILQRPILLQNAFTASFEIMGCIFERCSQLNDPSTSYLLPGVMVFVEWLACRHDVAVSRELDEKQYHARSFFWNKCISLLNKLFSSGYVFCEDKDETCFSNMSKYDENETANRLALPEDYELRGFLPLIPAQIIIDFSRKHSFGVEGSNKEKISRVRRIIAAGKSLANVVRLGQEVIYFDVKLKEFVIGIEPQVPEIQSSLLESNLDTSSLDVLVGEDQFNVSKLDVDVQDEDKDEVIVFKPSTIEKHLEELSVNFSSSEILSTVSGDGTIGAPYENGSLSVRNNDFPFRNAVTASMRPSLPFTNVTSQYLQPVHPSQSNWISEQAQLGNGLANMLLMNADPSQKPELKDQDRISQPAHRSVHQFVSSVTDNDYSAQIPRSALSSNFGSIMSSGIASDSLSVRQSSVIPTGLKKNPVSRPVRHLGPPPGFGSIRSNIVDKSLNSITLKKESLSVPLMDDYSWLDGYSLSSSNPSVGFNNSINAEVPMHSSRNSDSMGIESFPLPGKQLAALQVQWEKQKGLSNHQFTENSKLYGEQHQPFQKGNLQPIGPPQQYQVQPGNQQSAGPTLQYQPTQQYQVQPGNQQSVGPPPHYQGQSIWDGRFLV